MSLSRILANIGTALDSATTGDFLSKVDSDGVFGGVAYSSVTGTPTVLDSANVTNLVDSAYVQLRQSAVSGGGLDSATTISLVDSDYITSRATASGFQMFEYDATAGQTDFTGSDTNGNTLAYSEYGLLVHYNGILLSGATDYTATDGTTVVLTDSADEGARITIAKWSLASAGGAGGAAATWYGDRGVLGGGYDMDALGATNTIAYFDITTLGNASDFGDLTTARYYPGAVSDGTYGVWGGGNTDSRSNVIDYITISTTSNATDFGDLDAAREYCPGSSDGTTGLFMGGYDTNWSNVIVSIIIASPGNATDFGDLTVSSMKGAACSDGTYGVHGGGQTSTNNYENTIGYVTIATASNATDFGDLTVGRQNPGAAGNDTYGIFAGGRSSVSNTNTMDYITIATTSNATDFGDLTLARKGPEGAGNNTRATFGPGVQGSSQAVIDYVSFDTPGNAADFGDPSINYGSYYAATSGSPS